MSRDSNPSPLDEGHGPLSSADEWVGGLDGAALGAYGGAQFGGPPGAVADALAGFAVGEELVDVDD